MPQKLPTPAPPLHVTIVREQFSQFYLLTTDNGHTEEFDIDETRAWFKERGADMEVVQKALDHAWNFIRAEVDIEHPKEPPRSPIPYAPDI
jgi:hypothetical protein